MRLHPAAILLAETGTKLISHLFDTVPDDNANLPTDQVIKNIKESRVVTTFGPVEVIEQLLRIKRGGAELRPFCRESPVKHRGYSLWLQRLLPDFGSEASFGQAVCRLQEHYAIEVPVEEVRQHALRHGKAMTTLAAPVQVASRIIRIHPFR